MPLELITTIGGATSNSYLSIVDAQAYFDYRLGSEVWMNESSSDNKIRALVAGAKRLNDENWRGSRVTATQILAWPRSGVEKVDAVGGGWLSGYPFYGRLGETYDDNEIPQQIKDAQCELALAYLDGFDDGEQDAIDQFSTDGVLVKFRSEKPSGGLPSRVQQLIGSLTAGNRLVRA